MEGREPPWSRNQLRKLGSCIRDGRQIPNGLPSYADVMAWHNLLAADIVEQVDAADWRPILGKRPMSSAARPKTIDTLRQKLRRDRNLSLPAVQDLAGVRFEADMSLDEQDAAAAAISEMFGHGVEAIRDLRVRPHSGYRAVHVWLRLPAGRVEVQVRTKLQGVWANMYEAAADVLGREIRYGEFPRGDGAGIVRQLHGVSETIAGLESARNIATGGADASAQHMAVAERTIVEAMDAVRAIFEAWKADKAREV